MNLVKYETIIKVYEEGNISTAAEKLFVTQSSVSQTVTSVEKEFGISIFYRKKSGMKLTSNGEKIIKSMEEVIKANDKLLETINEINGLKCGILKVGIFQSVAQHWIPDILDEFKAIYPDIKIELLLGNYDEIEKAILDGKVDCGFITSAMSDKLKFVPITRDEIVVIMSKKHKMSDRLSINVDELSELDFILPSEGSNYDLGRMLKQYNIKLNIKYALNDDYTAIALAEKGLGVTILPELIVEGTNYEICKKSLNPIFDRLIGIGIDDKEKISSICKVFIEFVKEADICTLR